MWVSSFSLNKWAQLTFSLARRASLSAWRALRTLLNSLFWVTDHPVLKWGVMSKPESNQAKTIIQLWMKYRYWITCLCVLPSHLVVGGTQQRSLQTEHAARTPSSRWELSDYHRGEQALLWLFPHLLRNQSLCGRKKTRSSFFAKTQRTAEDTIMSCYRKSFFWLTMKLQAGDEESQIMSLLAEHCWHLDGHSMVWHSCGPEIPDPVLFHGLTIGKAKMCPSSALRPGSPYLPHDASCSLAQEGPVTDSVTSVNSGPTSENTGKHFTCQKQSNIAKNKIKIKKNPWTHEFGCSKLLRLNTDIR